MKNRNLAFGLVVSMAILSANAQEGKPFIDHLTMPLEMGFAQSPSSNLTNSGVYFKTCLEYRQSNTHGWCFAVEYDEYDFDYKDYRFKGINATDGTIEFGSFYAGPGYRWALTTDKNKREQPGIFSLAVMLQPGINIAYLKNVEVNGQDYKLKTENYKNFSIKSSIQLEYFLNRWFSLFIAEGYYRPIGEQMMRSSDSPVLTTSFGFATFF